MSLQQRVIDFWHGVQHVLFPYLTASCGELTESHQRVIAVLEMVEVEQALPGFVPGTLGRPPHNRRCLAHAFLAKAVLRLPTTKTLVERLQVDATLRKICGWEHAGDVPKESTFSRAFGEFAALGLPSFLHQSLVADVFREEWTMHICRDSTAIAARERAAAKVAVASKVNARRGRPKKVDPIDGAAATVAAQEEGRLQRQPKIGLAAMLADLPTACDVGCKMDAQGFKRSWKGYKFHWDVTDSGIPISCILTSASLHDSQVAIPLATSSAQWVESGYEIMDAAYDASAIAEYIRGLGHVPLTDSNPRHGEKRAFFPFEAQRYRVRSAVERANARLKNEFGGTTICVKGPAKVLTHLMFGVLALTVDTVLRWAG